MPSDAALTRQIACRRFKNGNLRAIFDDVAQEIRILVRVEGGDTRELFASPLDPEGLVLGHAALEMLDAGFVPVVRRWEGPDVVLDAVVDRRPAAEPGLPGCLAATELLALVTRFIAAPGLWDDTGCFHRAALFDVRQGDFVVRAEDIGRHNCLDRLAGWGVRHETLPAEHILFLSCRVTASMMAKALRAGIRFVVSRSAITAAALAMAREAGVTLVGFARDAESRFTIFTDQAGRILT